MTKPNAFSTMMWQAILVSASVQHKLQADFPLNAKAKKNNKENLFNELPTSNIKDHYAYSTCNQFH